MEEWGVFIGKEKENFALLFYPCNGLEVFGLCQRQEFILSSKHPC